MALVLAMQEGRSFYVDNTRVEIERISAPGTVKVKVVGPAMDQVYNVTDTQRVEILPDVYAQLGLGSSATMIKIVLEAPKRKRILRDSLYDAQEKPAA